MPPYVTELASFAVDTGIDDGGEANKPVAAAALRPDPVRRWTLGICALLGVLLVLQVVSDRTAPVTSLATVEALVVPIASQVAGEISVVNVADNKVVQPGDTLFQIDATSYRLAVETAEAQLLIAGQNIGASTAQVSTAQARLAERRAALSNVRSQSQRTAELVLRGVLAQARGDQAEADLKRAEAEVAASESEVSRTQAALGPAGENNPQLRAAVSALETARLNLSRTDIVSPSRGYVTNLRVGAGQYAPPGQPLVTLVDMQGAWVVAWFRENQIGNLRIGAASSWLWTCARAKCRPAESRALAAASRRPIRARHRAVS
jgi:multidrug resistance efflux pump